MPSHHVILCHTMPCHVASRHVMSCRIKSCHVIFSSYTLADVHTHLEKDFITLEITLPNDQPQYCFIFGLRDHFVDTYPEHPATSYDEPLENGFYFGCRYEVKLYLQFVDTFTTLTTFNIPSTYTFLLITFYLESFANIKTSRAPQGVALVC